MARSVPLERPAPETKLTAWQFSRRLNGPRPLLHVLAHTKREVGQILLAWESRYADQWPNLRLAQWTASLTGYCLDERIDMVGFKRVCMNALVAIVRGGLDAELRAGGDGSGPEFGERLRAAAIRQMSRGSAMVTVDGDPITDGLRFSDVDGDQTPRGLPDAA